MAIAGGRVVALEGVDGLRALLEQGDGRPFDELIDAIAPIVGFEILRLGEHVQRLCDPAAGWVDPASPVLIDRYRPPKLTATGYVFHALARRPDRDDLVRIEIDRATLAVTGPQRQSSRRGGDPPPGIPALSRPNAAF